MAHPAESKLEMTTRAYQQRHNRIHLSLASFRLEVLVVVEAVVAVVRLQYATVAETATHTSPMGKMYVTKYLEVDMADITMQLKRSWKLRPQLLQKAPQEMSCPMGFH